MSTELRQDLTYYTELVTKINLLEEEKREAISRLSASFGAYLLKNKMFRKITWEVKFYGEDDQYRLNGRINKNTTLYKLIPKWFWEFDLPGYKVSTWIGSDGSVQITGTISELGRLIRKQDLFVDTSKLTERINQLDSWTDTLRKHRHDILLGKQE